MKLKKINIWILVVALICATLVPAASFAGESDATETIAPDFVYMQGWHDIWRYSDGKTWQNTGSPNSWQELDFTWSFKPKGEIESITAVYFPEETDSENKAFPENPDYTSNAVDYSIATDKFILKKSSGLDLYSNGKLSIPIKYCLRTGKPGDTGEYLGFDIKEYDWQAAGTRGYRYFFTIKVKVTYKGGELQAEESDPNAVTEAAIEESTPPAITNTPVSGCAETIPFNVSGKSHVVYCSGCVCSPMGGCYCPGHRCIHDASYTAKLTVSGTLDAVFPNGNSTTFKSGYGFTVTSSSKITVTKTAEHCTRPDLCSAHLYDNTNHGATIAAPNQGEVRTTATYNQKGWVVKNEDIKRLYKKSNYTQPRVVALEKVNAGSLSSSFKTAYNKASNNYYEKGQKEKSRVIYTDIALSGTRQKPAKHSIDIYLCGGGVTYNGQSLGIFCGTCNKTFTINGNMYEDHRIVTGSGKKWQST